jgi:hypothetical protein
MTNVQITIIAESFESAALEFHRRNLAEEGYRLAGPISTSRLEMLDGNDRDVMFDGKPMYMVTFVKNN